MLLREPGPLVERPHQTTYREDHEVLARREHGGRELAQRGLGRRLQDEVRLADERVQREGAIAVRLAGAPWIEQQKIDLDAITKETLIFEGPATEAVKAFPANVNVVAAVSLASVGPERTRIRIYAVPGQARNQHRVVVEGEFGRLAVEIENVPSENPRTGKLSYLSAIAMLRELGAPLQIGN